MPNFKLKCLISRARNRGRHIHQETSANRKANIRVQFFERQYAFAAQSGVARGQSRFEINENFYLSLAVFLLLVSISP